MNGAVWVASYVILWIVVVLLCLAVVVLLRQIGVLHARIRPMGVHFANEGPLRGAPAPMPERFAFSAQRLTLVTFASQTCTICATLLPSMRALEREYDDVSVQIVMHSSDSQPVFDAYRVRSTPYVVAVDAAGIVRGGGVANSLEQVEVLVEAAEGETAA